MTQHDMDIANADGATVRADLNVAFQAIAENNSGATAPSTTFAFQLWADTANDLMMIRNSANSAWITAFRLSTAGMVQGADVASAAALPVLVDGVFNDVTGTTTITSIDALGIGTLKFLQFDGVLTITHHATNLILPGGKNIITVAGDVLGFYEYAANDWRLVSNSADALPYRKGADVASAAALPVLDSGAFDVTGTTTITSIDSVGVGAIILLQFDGIVTVTHNATDIVLPGGTNITTVAGQILVFHEYASGDWRLVSDSLGGAGGQVEFTDVTITGSAASTPDANTLTKDHMIGARCTFNGTGVPAYIEEINFSGAITDNGAGDYTLTIDRDFANANYTADGAVNDDGGSAIFMSFDAKVVGSIQVLTYSHAGALTDKPDNGVVLFGAQ